MKKTTLLVLMVLTIVAIPVTAQSRKEKKAAETAQWEQTQKYQQDEAALRHQIKMDSIANAQKVAEEKAKAEADALAAQETTLNEPCMEVRSTQEYILSRGVAESLNHQVARTKAQSNSLRDLAAKINTSVKSLLQYYFNDKLKDQMSDETSSLSMYIEEETKNLVKQVTDENLSFSTYCEETRSYMKNNRKVYKCYMTIQVDKNSILKPTFEQIQQDEKIRMDMEYEKFVEEFNRIFDEQP